MPPQLEPVKVPIVGAFIYSAFWELFQSEGISWGEIYHYQKVYSIEFSGDELHTLIGLSKEAISWMNKDNKAKMKIKSPKNKK